MGYLSENSPYYKKVFLENNIAISEIKLLEDLEKLPVTTKEDLSKDKIKAFFDKQGIRRVSKILGYDPASLWRFTDTQTHPIPQIIQVIVKIVNFIDRSQ